MKNTIGSCRWWILFFSFHFILFQTFSSLHFFCYYYYSFGKTDGLRVSKSKQEAAKESKEGRIRRRQEQEDALDIITALWACDKFCVSIGKSSNLQVSTSTKLSYLKCIFLTLNFFEVGQLFSLKSTEPKFCSLPSHKLRSNAVDFFYLIYEQKKSDFLDERSVF